MKKCPTCGRPIPLGRDGPCAACILSPTDKIRTHELVDDDAPGSSGMTVEDLSED